MKLKRTPSAPAGQPDSLHHCRDDRGDTLVEVVIAVAIIAIAVTAIMGGLSAVIATSGTNRSITALDTIVRSFAETARDEIQLQPVTSGGAGPTFTRCATSYQLASGTFPSGGPFLTSSTVFVTGLSASSGIKVTVGSVAATVSSPSPANTNASGNATVTFTVPSTAPTGVQPVVVSDSAGHSVTSTFYVGDQATVTSLGTNLSSYSVALGAVQTWNGTAFATPCNSNSTNSDLQQLNIEASAPGASDALNLVVSNPNYVPTPTVGVAVSPTSATVGTSVKFTATVTPPPVNGGTPTSPTGSVTWQIEVSQGTAPNCTTTGLSDAGNGAVQASCTFIATVAGSYQAIAQYSGDGNYNAASSSGNLTVAKATPTVTVADSPANPTYGATLTFTAAVAPPSGGAVPTGQVTWTITGPAGTTPVCSSPPTPANPVTLDLNGMASCSVSNTVTGNYFATAAYGGDVNYLTASGNSSTLTVPKPQPSVVVVGTPSTPAYGNTLTFTATVSPSNGGPTPTGTVTWSGVTCSSTMALGASTPGVATCTVTGVKPGSYTAVAAYGGNTTYATASGTSNTLTVAKVVPTVTVSASPTSPVTGNPVTFTALVTGTTGLTLTGSVTWSGVTCNSTTALSVTGNTGTATCTISHAVAGQYSATASYGSDTYYATEAGSSGPVTVTQATPTVTVAASPTSPTYGSTLTFTAIVSSATGGVTPTGSVKWTLTGPSGTCATSTLNAGVATCSVTSGVVGTYSATAAYQGDTNYLGATSSASLLTVPKVTPTVTVSGGPSNPLYGTTVTFTATVHSANGAPTPTGTVTWTGVTCTSTTTLSGGVATCQVASVKPGSYTATAVYSGDGNYVGVTSPASNTLTVPTLTPATITVIGTPTTPVYGNHLTFTLTATAPTGDPAPSGGTVTWTVNGSTTVCAANTLNTGTATCVIASAVPGTYTVTASYAGDSNYGTFSGSGSLVVPPLTATVNVGASPTLPTYPSNDTLTFSATVTGATGGPTLGGTLNWTGVTCTSKSAFSISGITGTQTCTVAGATPGSYAATASYQSDPNYTTASYTSSTLTVARVSTTVSLAAAYSNGTVTFSATASTTAGLPAPSGPVAWTVNGSATACGSTTLSGGAATCAVAVSGPGTYLVTATYGGDTNYAAPPAPTSSTFHIATLGVGAVQSGTQLKFTVTLSVPSGGTAPNGSVTWAVTGGATNCSSTTALAGTSPTYIATCTVNSPQPGTYDVAAGFAGDSTYLSTSTSGSYNAVNLALSSVVTGRRTFTMTTTATLTIPSGGPAPTGTVTWTVSGAGTSCTGGSTSLAGTSPTYTSTCTVSNAVSATNNYTFIAGFAGDSYYLPVSVTATESG